MISPADVINTLCNGGDTSFERALKLAKPFIKKAIKTNTLDHNLLRELRLADENSGFSELFLTSEDKQRVFMCLDAYEMDPVLRVFLREVISYAIEYATHDVVVEPSWDWDQNPLNDAYRMMYNVALEMWKRQNKLIEALDRLEELAKKHGTNFEAQLREENIQETLRDFKANKADSKKNATTWLAANMVGIMKGAVRSDGTVDKESPVFRTAHAYWQDNLMSREQMETPLVVFAEVLADKPKEMNQVKECFTAFYTWYRIPE